MALRLGTLFFHFVFLALPVFAAGPGAGTAGSIPPSPPAKSPAAALGKPAECAVDYAALVGEREKQHARRIVGALEPIEKRERVARAWKYVVSMERAGSNAETARVRADMLRLLLGAIPEFRMNERPRTPDGSIVFESPGPTSYTDSEIQFFAVRASDGMLYRGSRERNVPADWNPDYEDATMLKP